jgi:hypothetical protein
VTASRLARDTQNRPICIDADGRVYLVLDLAAVCGFIPPGRPPTPRERAEARPPYSSGPNSWHPRQRREVPDEELADKEAVKLARLEQQRQPADLIGHAA